MLTRSLAYVKGLVRRNAIDAEVDEELRFHLEMETQANIERGMPPAEARRSALRDLGGATQTREAVRDVRAIWFDAMTRDFRQAFRSLARTPCYLATAVGVIALAIALTTAVLAVVDGMLFKPLPYRQPDRLFVVTAGFTKLPAEKWHVASARDVVAWREAVPELPLAVFASSLYDTDTLEAAALPLIDARFFALLGVPIQGPGFTATDFTASQPISPVLITHAVWQNHYGFDPSVIGRTYVNRFGRTKRIVGILPAGFIFPHGPWLTETVEPLTARDSRMDPRSRGKNLTALIRLPPGVTPEQIAQRLTAASRRLAATSPPAVVRPDATERMRIVSGPFDTVRLEPLRESLADRAAVSARIVFWAAVALMLLACLNVAGLAVARVQDRQRDLVIRRAIGARYFDLVRLLACENVIVAACGMALGVLGARALLAVTTGVMPRSLLFLKPPVVDGRVLMLSSVAAVAALLFITFLPARVVWSGRLQALLATGGTVTRRSRRVWTVVSGQVALVTVIGVGAALVAGSLVRVWHEDPGFQVSRVADLTVGTFRAPAGTVEGLLSAIRRVAGVQYAGAIDHLLLERGINGNEFERPAGALSSGDGPSDVVEQIGVTSGYLEAMGLRPIDGRLLTETECSVGAPVIVVSQGVARQYWPGKRAVGQTLTHDKGRVFVVVGVVPDARYLALDMNPQPAIYVPGAKLVAHLVASFDDSHRAGVRELVATFKNRCPSCTVYRAQMLSDSLGASIKPRRFNAWLFSSFGIAALFIVGVGILGLVAMTTGRRTQEIGVRMALGSTRTGVVRQILAEQAVSVFAGLLAGGVGAAWLVKYVKSYLYKTPLYDAWSWGAATALIVAIVLVGALIPSLRASRIDPMRALRVE